MYLNFTLAKYTLIKDIKRYEWFPHYYRTFKWSIPPLRGIAWKTNNILATVIVRNKITDDKLIDDLSQDMTKKAKADKNKQS